MLRHTMAALIRYVLLAVVACPVIATAQMVRGTVTDANSGLRLKAVNLSLYTTEGQRLVRSVSDDDGKFEMVLPKGKTVYVQAERIGYKTVKSAPISASTSELLELNVRLSVEAVPLQGIEVAARRQADPRLQPFLDRASLYKRSGMGHIWTRKELEQRHPALVSSIINYWVPARREFNCSGTSVFIDDFPVDADDVDLLVAPDQLEGVELYSDMYVPQDILLRARSLATPPDAAGGGSADVVPPCKTVMLWRKPYGELHPEYGPHRVALWRALAGAALLGVVLLVEYSL